MWFIGVEVEQETSALPPKKNPGSAPGFNLTFAVNVKRTTKVVCHIFQKVSGKSGWKASGTRLSGCSSEKFPERKIFGSKGISPVRVGMLHTSFRFSRPFFGKLNWFVQMVNGQFRDEIYQS